MTETREQTRKIAVLVAGEGIEQIELTSPWQALEEAGWTPVLISPEAGRVQAYNHLDAANTFPSMSWCPRQSRATSPDLSCPVGWPTPMR